MNTHNIDFREKSGLYEITFDAQIGDRVNFLDGRTGICDTQRLETHNGNVATFSTVALDGGAWRCLFKREKKQ